MHIRSQSVALSDTVKPYLHQHKKILVAFSGGLDSTVLLHFLVTLKQSCGLHIRAVHVHHGLSVHADEWTKHAQDLCRQWDVPCIIEHVTIKGSRNIEEQARQARYLALMSHLLDGEVVMTAQHLDDQCETFLLALKRGSGPTGLAGMPDKMPFGPSALIRPLLSVSRSHLEMYANANNLTWVEDESNQDRRYDRNFLRHTVIPALTQRWPHFNHMVARSAALCAEETTLLAELVNEEMTALLGTQQELPLEPLHKMSAAKRHAVLRAWFKLHQVKMPSRQHLELLWTTVAMAKADANPLFKVDQHTVRRFQHALYIIEPHSTLSDTVLSWDLISPLTLPQDLGKLHCGSNSQGPLRLPREDETVFVRFRGRGRVTPVGRSGSRSFKKLWQELGVPPWQRDRIPLLYYNEVLISAVGLFITEEGLGHDMSVTLEKT